MRDSVAIAAIVVDNEEVESVEFHLDGALFNEIRHEPFESIWDTRESIDGLHILQCTARDSSGNETNSDSIRVIVQNTDITPPEVSILSPADGDTISGTIMVQTAAADDECIDSIDFLLNGDLLGVVEDEPFELLWDTGESPDGSHILQCEAKDVSGNETLSEIVHLLISNGPQLAVEEITFTNADNVELAGTLFRVEGSNIGAVLAHSGVPGQNQSRLHFLAYELADRGCTVLTFDLRGYGQTGGPPAYGLVHRDIRAALDVLRAEGFSRVALFGVGLGGIACAKVCMEPDVVGLVLISCPTSVSPPSLVILHSDLSIAYPKLIIAAQDDFAAGRPFAEYARTIYGYAVDPKELKIFTGPYHSMELFSSEHGDELRLMLYSFFEGLR